MMKETFCIHVTVYSESTTTTQQNIRYRNWRDDWKSTLLLLFVLSSYKNIGFFFVKYMYNHSVKGLLLNRGKHEISHLISPNWTSRETGHASNVRAGSLPTALDIYSTIPDFVSYWQIPRVAVFQPTPLPGWVGTLPRERWRMVCWHTIRTVQDGQWKETWIAPPAGCVWPQLITCTLVPDFTWPWICWLFHAHSIDILSVLVAVLGPLACLLNFSFFISKSFSHLFQSPPPPPLQVPVSLEYLWNFLNVSSFSSYLEPSSGPLWEKHREQRTLVAF